MLPKEKKQPADPKKKIKLACCGALAEEKEIGAI